MTKYRAIKTVVDGITFDSKKEAKRYSELKMMEKAGIIATLRLQPEFKCMVKGKKVCTYKADFEYLMVDEEGPDGQIGYYIVEDVKGFKTPVYRLKKKLVEACYPGTVIKEIQMFDNGLTKEQQVEMDARYENLMAQVKEIDLKLYRKLRANELPGTISDKVFVANQDDQLEMLL